MTHNTHNTKKLPLRISEYINGHFREDFLCRVKEVKNVSGHMHYFVEVTKDAMIYRLRFNEQGNLEKEEAEQAFPPDIHEEDF